MNIVKELRIRAGMQQKELALIVGVSAPTVSDWEHGRKNPSGERLRKLSQVFGVDAGTILGYDLPPILAKPKTNTTPSTETPKTQEAQLISGAVDAMPQEDRERALNMMKAVYSEYFDRTEEKNA